jgi:hypothetical protein
MKHSVADLEPVHPLDAQLNNGHSANGHVNGQSKAQSEPYFDEAVFINGQLADDHREILRTESGLSDETIDRRGYFTTDDKATLKCLGFPSNLGRCLIIPIYNWRGKRVGYQARLDIPFNKAKYLLPKGSPPTLDIPPAMHEKIDDPNEPAILTEGIKKGDKAAEYGFPVIVLNGVYAFRGRNAKGGITALADWEYIAIKGRVFYIVFDSDVTANPRVESALHRLCAFLNSRGATVKVVYLPSGPNGEKTGLDDFFVRGGTTKEFYSLARDLEAIEVSKKKRKEEKVKEKLEALQADGLPIIETNDRQLPDKLQDFANALNLYNGQEPRVFHGTAGLVIITRDKDGEPVLQTIGREGLQVLAGKAAKWISSTEREGIRNVTPPRDLCEQFLNARDYWKNIPPIDHIATVPFFDSEGNLCDREGYSASTRNWLHLDKNFKIPDTTPTAENVSQAKSLIFDNLLAEVAFADAASRAHAVALMLLPAIMPLIHDDTPLHLWDAPQQSNGKTYGARVCIAPTCEAVPSPDKKNNEENRKELFSKLLSGPSNVFIDNVKSNLNDPTLATAITSPHIEGRILGASHNVRVSTRVVWIATSNNAQLDRDAISRCIMIKLDANEEHPEDRVFKGDPLQYISTHRDEVVGAIITLIRNWQAQGSPEKTGKTRSRFKRWEKVMGGILQANGITGFLDNADSTRQVLDPEADAWREFVATWYQTHGTDYITAKELLPTALKCDELAAIIGEKEGQVTRFGKLLATERDKVLGGLKIIRSSGKGGKGANWRVKPVNSPKNYDDHGNHEDNSYNTRNPQNLGLKEENELTPQNCYDSRRVKDNTMIPMIAIEDDVAEPCEVFRP